ncbi:phosphotransferase family protein [Chachezhania antarctica]|uniref:phosphotransferase family protein n=1 Tax=Chachezhania antarctica TaxID=2340860 RepID=UPI000EAB4DAB|nr:aminoglycoside phosphotransferase family protein [Chachezhania antarctica]|tara:strand:+ start:1942 stop:2862 length:921 start_codon:yes stop_codon:yes gene_type:complete
MTLTRPIFPDPTFGAPPSNVMEDLRRHGIRAAPRSVEPLHGGRTNRLWRLSTDSDVLVLKLYSAPDDNPLFENDPEREGAALVALAGSLLAPRFHLSGATAAGSWLLYHHVPGGTWESGAQPVAEALGRIHAFAGMQGTLPVRPGGSRALRAQGLQALAGTWGQDRAELDALQEQLSDVDIPPVASPAPIHGDPVPGNAIPGPSGVVFIDWQCPALGDPAEDLALFLSPAMQMLYRGAPLDAGAERDFLEAYPDKAVVERHARLKPWFHWRMAAYCLWQVARGNHDYADGFVLERDALKRQRSLSA